MGSEYLALREGLIMAKRKRKGCENKKRYPTYEAAAGAVNEISQKKFGFLDPYFCSHHQCFHVRNVRRRKRRRSHH